MNPAGALPEPADAAPPPEPEAEPSTRALILKNTLYLTIAEALAMPLSIANTALHARYLGAGQFGSMYSAGALCALGFLAVEWGQPGSLAAQVARDRPRSGALLGTALVWRLLAGLAVYAVSALGAHLTGYDASFQYAFVLMFAGYGVSSLLSACQDTVRGFERMDVAAFGRVVGPIVTMVVATPVLLVSGQLGPVLIANGLATALILLVVYRWLPRVGVGPLVVRRDALTHLLVGGTPFVALGVTMVLQPQIDAYFISKLASAEVMGWYAGGRKLIGVLLFPASALIGALYPTMSRLFISDRAAFVRTANGSLRGVSLLAVPVALACFCFPQVGISLLSSDSFAPAEDNLRVLSLFLFLVYFSMPIGVCMIAGGKQRAWASVQALCVLVSLVLDPLLVPLAQTRYGNGGLGVCVASVISEIAVIACGLWMLPRAALDGKLLRSVFLALLSGVPMVAVAWFGRSLPVLLVAPCALFAYAAALWLTGGLETEHVEELRAFGKRKFAGLLRRLGRAPG